MVPTMLLLLSVAYSGPTASLDVEVVGARSRRGVIRICVTQDQRSFPDCKRDSKALKRTFQANMSRFRVSGLTPGTYAVTLLHDENANGKLDTMLGIPREGFGFSRNPVVRFGAPKYKQVVVQLAPGINRQMVRLQYLL